MGARRVKLFFAKVRMSLAIAWFQGTVLLALARATWNGYVVLVRAVWSIKA